MAFNDFPVVDKNSERSEESVLQVKSMFMRKAGFISREETPDNGVDLNVELVSLRGATSNIFAIQIKSAAQVNAIQYDGKDYISIQFKTSRLGHLCRRPPAYGIVTVYDEASKVTYYDFVEEIVNRLTFQRENEDWKNQDEVNIRVPLNVLDSESASVIHQKMTIRFTDHSMLLQAFGDLYRIPSLGSKIDNGGIDLNDIRQVEKFLKEHGLGLFNSRDYNMVMELLGRLPSTTIIRSKELVLLAALIFGQSGMTIESDYYLQRSKAHTEGYNEEEKFLIDYTILMMRFRKGEIDHSKFREGLLLLKEQSANSINAITIDINLIYTKFLEQEAADNNTLGPIYEIFLRIERSDLAARDKALLKLFNLENLHNYGTGLLLKDAGKYKIQEKLGIHVPMQDRFKRAKSVIEILSTATLETHNILKESIESSDKLVNTFAAYYKARFFFMTNFQSMMLGADEPQQTDEQRVNIYENNINFCYQSISLFFELSLWHEGHQSLCCAYDLQVMHHVLYNVHVGSKTIEELEENMRKIELGTGIRKYESIVKSTFDSLSSRDKGSERNWANVPDDQVEKFAQIVLDAYEIPNDRLIHIISDINTHKIFYRECTNPDLELLQDLSHLQMKQTTYATAPVYVIQSKKSGIQSRRSSNIKDLLDQFSTILKIGG